MVGTVLAVLVAVGAVTTHDVLAGSGGVPASAAVSLPAQVRTRVVAQPGDTLWSIASAHHGQISITRYVDVLRDDDLPGKPGDPDHSWLGLMRFDYVTMVDALGGDSSALKAVTVQDTAPDRAAYPQ